VTLIPSHFQATNVPEALARTAPAPPASTRSIFGECLVFRVEADGHQPRPPLSLTETVTRSMRAAVMRFSDDPPPAVLSGHAPDGRMLETPHAAFLALPADVCAPEGRIREATVGGVAIALPGEVHPRDRAAIVCALERWERAGFRLLLGGAGVMRLSRETGARLDAWVGPARRWASVTPVALERNPGQLLARDPAKAAAAVRHAEETVARGCAHVGLPRPTRVRVAPRSLFAGAPPASAFAPYPRRGNGFKRVCVHTELEFAQPVQGPVVLGVGRYFGVGVCGVRET
jgi:CRISPR-associated protein Csb2